MNLAELGFTKEELQERVVAKICDDILSAGFYDYEDGEPQKTKSGKLSRAMTQMVERRIQQAVDRIAAEYVEPSVIEYVKNFTIQQTNSYGEPLGRPTTFTEYLVARANAYIAEPVDHNGESQAEAKARGNSWYGSRTSQTRVVHLIDKHLQYSIAVAMETAVKGINDSITEGITATVKIKLAEVLDKLKKK